MEKYTRVRKEQDFPAPKADNEVPGAGSGVVVVMRLFKVKS